MPAGVLLQEGVSENEAIASALWNRAAFQADIAALGFSRADVVEAGLLRNPILSLHFPLGPKQFEATFNWPIEAIWQRPRRIAAAQLDAAKVGESLVENGLNVVREVRLAHADAVRAQERLALARDQLMIRRQILTITDARLRAGDISEIELERGVGRQLDLT